MRINTAKSVSGVPLFQISKGLTRCTQYDCLPAPTTASKCRRLPHSQQNLTHCIVAMNYSRGKRSREGEGPTWRNLQGCCVHCLVPQGFHRSAGGAIQGETLSRWLPPPGWEPLGGLWVDSGLLVQQLPMASPELKWECFEARTIFKLHFPKRQTSCRSTCPPCPLACSCIQAPFLKDDTTNPAPFS
jgi:hypothetical protein